MHAVFFRQSGAAEQDQPRWWRRAARWLCSCIDYYCGWDLASTVLLLVLAVLAGVPCLVWLPRCRLRAFAWGAGQLPDWFIAGMQADVLE